MIKQSYNSLAEKVYQLVKAEIFDFHLLPGDRFTETDFADRYGVSRTPLRDALYRLKREGFLEVYFRSGWGVCPIDFDRIDQFYDLRILLETNAVERVCEIDMPESISAMKKAWLVPASERETDPLKIAALDESFHSSLVAATGNHEASRVHLELTEKIRIIRRLDFFKAHRIEATYEEHAKLVRLIMRRKATEASILIRSHITQSKNEVRKITLHMLHEARSMRADWCPVGGEFVVKRWLGFETAHDSVAANRSNQAWQEQGMTPYCPFIQTKIRSSVLPQKRDLGLTWPVIFVPDILGVMINS